MKRGKCNLPVTGKYNRGETEKEGLKERQYYANEPSREPDLHILFFPLLFLLFFSFLIRAMISVEFHI